jgi:hypothetical protein
MLLPLKMQAVKKSPRAAPCAAEVCSTHKTLPNPSFTWNTQHGTNHDQPLPDSAAAVGSSALHLSTDTPPPPPHLTAALLTQTLLGLTASCAAAAADLLQQQQQLVASLRPCQSLHAGTANRGEARAVEAAAGRCASCCPAQETAAGHCTPLLPSAQAGRSTRPRQTLRGRARQPSGARRQQQQPSCCCAVWARARAPRGGPSHPWRAPQTAGRQAARSTQQTGDMRM